MVKVRLGLFFIETSVIVLSHHLIKWNLTFFECAQKRVNFTKKTNTLKKIVT